MRYTLFILLPSAFVLAAAQEVSAPQLTPEQKRQLMEQHYAKAFQLYSARDYARAIEHWNHVLKLDPDQQAAKRLLSDAREKLSSQNRERERRFQDSVEKGDFRGAYDVLQALLDADPTDQKRLSLQARLEKVVPILPRAAGRGRRAVVLRTGVAAYLGDGGRADPRLAYNAFRYARELDPKDSAAEKLLRMFESENPDLAQADQLPEGVGFLEYKRKAALDLIYDGKYPQALRACDEVLALEPDDVPTLKRYGSAYYQLGKRRSARRVWQKALRLSPDDKQLKKYLGKTAAAGEEPGPDAPQ